MSDKDIVYWKNRAEQAEIERDRLLREHDDLRRQLGSKGRETFDLLVVSRDLKEMGRLMAERDLQAFKRIVEELSDKPDWGKCCREILQRFEHYMARQVR